FLASGFALGREETFNEAFEGRMFERRIGRADNANSLLMRARDELAITGDDILGGDGFAWRSEWECRKENVVDAETEDDVIHPWLIKDIAIEARDPGFAERAAERVTCSFRAVMQQAVPDDSFIEDADFYLSSRISLQTLCEDVRPAAIRVSGGTVTVGERGTEGHHREGAWRSFDVYTCEKRPRVNRHGGGEFCRCSGVSGFG